MSYVGCIRQLRRQAPDGRVVCRGFIMDNARGVKFLASVEALEAYFADPDEDTYIDVPDNDVTWLAKRDGGRSLWSSAGLPWSIG